MDSPVKRKEAPVEDRERPRLRYRFGSKEELGTKLYFPLHYPINLLGDIMAAIFHFLGPYTPNLIPLVVFLLALPVIAFLSASAGYLVWRSVAVAWETDLHLQYGDGVAPYAEAYIPNILTKQPYDISMHLVVPATEANYALGNFMSALTLVTPYNKTLAHVRKPTIVLPPSSAPWSFLRTWPGTVDLDIPLLTSFVMDVTRVIARVELGRRDQWKSIGNGEGRELSVLSAVLRGTVVHKGIRGIISRFPLLSALIAAATFLVISFVVLASCMLPALEFRFDNDPPTHIVSSKRKRMRQRPTSTSEVDERTRKTKSRKGSGSASGSGSIAEQREANVPEPTSASEASDIKPDPYVELDPLDPGLDLQQPRSLEETEQDYFSYSHDPHKSEGVPIDTPNPLEDDTVHLRRRRSRPTDHQPIPI